MKVLADQYLYKLEHFLPAEAELHRFNPAEGFPPNAVEYDALLIRTVTHIDSETLPKPGNLKFIGTATAGVDHVDVEWLKELKIGFGYAAGCNAIAVGEFVLTVLLKWALDRKVDLRDKSVCVIGCGHTGGEVISLLNRFDIPNFGYDPPKQDREEGFESVGPDKLLSCDILTFHVPFTKTGIYPTHHLFNKDWLVHPFDLVINASRGGVVDENALLRGLEEGSLGDMVLDVWENEPLFRDDVAEKAFIATPHIAGYSRESKERASRMVVEQMLEYFQIEADGKSKIDMRNNKESQNEEDSAKRLESLGQVFHIPEVVNRLWKLSNIEYYDQELRKLCGESDPIKAKSFATLRSETKLRSEGIEYLKKK